MFFQGRKNNLIQRWKNEMKRLSSQMKYEAAAEVRDRIHTLEHMNEHVLVNRLTEADLEKRIQNSRGVQKLMQVLSLPRPPERIECIDISHFQGQETVASLVSFYQGKPDKQNYRKFVITSVAGIDDFKSMLEVVKRRIRRLKNEAKPLPDLLLIDGGKGQLSSALQALKEEDVHHLAVAALAKENEEIYLPGRSEPLQLPTDSPALLLLRHVRDEAHRFAVTFNRRRRSVSFMKNIEYE